MTHKKKDKKLRSKVPDWVDKRLANIPKTPPFGDTSHLIDKAELIKMLEGMRFVDVSYNKTRKHAWNECLDTIIKELGG